MLSILSENKATTIAMKRKIQYIFITALLSIFVFKLAGGEQHFMLFADGKSTRDRRTSVARECSSLDGTK